MSLQRLLTLIVCLTTVCGCGLTKNEGAEGTRASGSATQAPSETSSPVSGIAPGTSALAARADVSSGGPATGTGTFKYTVTPAKTATLKAYEALFKASRLTETTRAMGVYRLPRDVPVVAAECGMVNAFYNRKQHAIMLCYELAEDWYKRFLARGMPDQRASNATLDALQFTLLHEMGHALIGELGLGVSGGEEDAVDDLAALILIQAKQPERAVAGTFALMEMGKGQRPAYFDEHSLGEQRFYNVLCLIYGSNPKGNADIMTQVPELKPRSGKCPTTYERADKFWTQTLTPHTRAR